MFGLQILAVVFRLGQGDLQVAVADAEIVDKGLELVAVFHSDLVKQLVQTAHVGGLGTHQAAGRSVFCKNVGKGVVEMQGLGDGNGKVHHLLYPHGDEGKHHHDGTDQQGEHHGDGHVACGTGQACGHGQEDGGDVLGFAGDGTEAHQGEGAHHRHAGAYVAVDHHDHGGDDHGQQDQTHQKALGGVGAEGGRKGCESPADERYRQGNEVGVHHGICVQNGIKGE